ncbi:MAG: DUF2252 family protein [Myxococcota bacterium]
MCRRFHEDPGPTVNLHGDAHIEQYAVTEIGRGLTDFDDAARGPPAIDLVRMASSFVLTCEDNDIPCDPILAAFFESYRTTLDTQSQPSGEPEWVKRIRDTFSPDRRAVLSDLDALMTAPQSEARFDKLYTAYLAQMADEAPDVSPSFLAAKRRGKLNVGVGSALDEKYLVRIEGPSASEDDDLFLEFKEVRDLSSVSCLSRVDLDSPLRVLRGQERLSYTPYNLVGYVVLSPEDPAPRAFWVHEWSDHYVEAEHNGFTDHRQLKEIARDVGAQLALGHPRSPDLAVSVENRTHLAEWLDRNQTAVMETAQALADAISAEWIARFGAGSRP